MGAMEVADGSDVGIELIISRLLDNSEFFLRSAKTFLLPARKSIWKSPDPAH